MPGGVFVESLLHAFQEAAGNTNAYSTASHARVSTANKVFLLPLAATAASTGSPPIGSSRAEGSVNLAAKLAASS